MSNNKEKNTERETVLVQLALPSTMHRDIKVEALLKKKGNGRKIDLQSVIIERLTRDLASYPVSEILIKVL